MYLVITLRKEVDDIIQGRAVYEIVKQKMADRPDVEVSGHITNHFDMEEATSGPPT